MPFKSTLVVAEELRFGSTGFGLAQGFRRLGWEVGEVSTLSSFIGGRTIPSKVLSRLLRPVSIRQYNSEIIRAVEEARARVFLTVKGNYILPNTLKELVKRGVTTVNYYPDFRFTYKTLDQNTFPLYSLFVTTKSYQVKTLEDLLGTERVRFLHHGYCTDAHKLPEEVFLSSARGPDVLYIGTHSRKKEQWLTAVRQNLPHISMVIYGNGWSEHAGHGVLAECIAPRAVNGMNYAQMVNEAKINVAIHYGAADDTGWEDLVSTRTFEIPACRGFMLHVDNKEIRQLYTPGDEIDVFSSAGELCEKIAFYLQHADLRQEMLEKAHRRCVPEYSYDARARTLEAWILSL